MESKLKRIRSREIHTMIRKEGRRLKKPVNEQGKEIRETINSNMEEQKIRSKSKIHQARRDEIQKSIREIISGKKGRRMMAQENRL